MHNINILDYEIHSCGGNLETTLESLKEGKSNMSTKKFFMPEDEVEIGFFSFKDEIKQDENSIKKSIKNLLLKITDKMSQEQKSATALIIGTSLIDWHLVNAINETVYDYKKTAYKSKKSSIDTYAKELSQELGLNDFTMTINTACTSSANALLEASNLIEAGVVDYAIALGIEIYSPLMSSGFYTMDLISPTCAKPFDKNRDGLVLGEALGAILLGKERSLWQLLGGYSNCNSQTITSVSQSGKECVEVMQKALLDADVTSSEITAIKAHATGSLSNDLAEINAISTIFDSSIKFTALKPYIGHTIGASGVVEISLFMRAIDTGFIPKTIECKEPILEDYAPLKENIECSSGRFMCNYFGFGGNNISLIIQKESL
jgi:3-oxoacyl-[acyl-carrier-protein] synthase-1